MPTPHSDLIGKLVLASGCSVGPGCCPDITGIIASIDSDGMVTTESNLNGSERFFMDHQIRKVWGDPDFQPIRGESYGQDF